MIKALDLTYYLDENMPVYPGTEGPIIKEICTMEAHGFREKLLTIYSHTGTHMDAPAHMLDKGKFLDEFHIDQFIGRALVLEIKEDKIDKQFLMAYEDQLKNLDFLYLKQAGVKNGGMKVTFVTFQL